MLDRTKAPQVQKIDSLTLPEPNKIVLDNGIPLYLLELGTQEVLKLEVVYYAGRPFEEKKLIGRLTARMLKEGTQQTSAEAIAEKVDFYGATLSVPVNLDTSSFILYSLTKHFYELIPLFGEVLHQPLFSERELNTVMRSHLQRLHVDMSKNDVVAYRQITEYIFGESHPYGYNSYPETYRHISIEDLQKHFERNYTDDNCLIFLSGRINEDTIPLINKYLGQRKQFGKPQSNKLIIENNSPDKIEIKLPDSVQTAIRMGNRLWNRHHPDYHGLYILNTILGGYFGSRLMTNIREEKGYTYNIFSSIDTMLLDGYFMIGTEVGNKYVEDTFHQINIEIDRLKTELVSAGELDMVRNYLLGNLMTMLDGPFNVSEIIRTLYVENVPLDEFEKLVHLIHNITPERIRALARLYLNPEQMWKVVVG